MNTSDINSLLEKYLNGTSTEQENAALETWYMRYENKSLADVADQVRIEQLDRIRKQVAQYSAPARTYKLWPRIAVAAAAVAAIVVGVWFYNTSRHVEGSVATRDLLVNDIAPGKNGATITLANGKVIQLSDAKSGVIVGQEIKYNDGSSVLSSRANAKDLIDSSELGMTKGGGAQTLTASTARGQTYQFTLPDGTKVWLNADSKLEFPSNFANSKTRNVKLSGEGYFEVSKDKAHPFILGTKNQDVTVLGTHFNISAYQEERLTTTTLVEGSVRVSAFDVVAGRRTEILKPNQQSIQTPNGGMQIRNVDVSEVLDWKNGDFVFRKESLASIMKRVARWYDIEVIYEKGVNINQEFGGKVSRLKNISAVLQIMQSTEQVKFKIEGRKVYVWK